MELVAGDWSSGPLQSAFGMVARWRGLMGRRPQPILIPTRSVHGFWLGDPVWVVALDGSLVVIGVGVLARRRIVVFARASWILELPIGRRPPPVGARLTWTSSDGESART